MKINTTSNITGKSVSLVKSSHPTQCNLKQIPSVLLTFFFIFFFFFTVGIGRVFAQQYDSEKDFQIDWDDNVKDGVKIIKYLGTKNEVSIPSRIQNYPVTGIGEKAFSYNRNITKVTIPDKRKMTHFTQLQG